MVVCWSVKGGSGTSVVAALVAMAAAKLTENLHLIDIAGDQPAIFGVENESELGVQDWLQGGPDVAVAALLRLARPVGSGVRLLSAGKAVSGNSSAVARAKRLRQAMTQGPSVVDAGTVVDDRSLAAAVAHGAPTSLIVLRPCFLAIRRASASKVRSTGIVLVNEPGRALDGRDIEDVLGVPVVATLPWDSALARSVDAGRIATRSQRIPKVISSLAAEIFGNGACRAV